MKCPTCVESGQRSTVHEGAVTTTLMGFSPFYDEDGAYHSHNPNRSSVSMECSNGHRWGRSWKAACPAGDYPPGAV